MEMGCSVSLEFFNSRYYVQRLFYFPTHTAMVRKASARTQTTGLKCQINSSICGCASVEVPICVCIHVTEI